MTRKFAYRHYVVLALLLAYVCNFMDRQILAILMQPIKEELALTDTQLGLLSGLAFALFYSTLGIPIASLADRSNRVNIISLSMAIWSALTAACGFATNFIQLFLLRLGVGIGEAGCTPPAHSLMSDYFDRGERSRAMGIYMQGVPIGIMLGLIVGGYVNEHFGWRMSFILVGLPGVIVALVLRLTVREVSRRGLLSAHAHPAIGDVFTQLFQIKSFRHIVFAHALFAWVAYGVTQWLFTYLIRRFDVETGGLGLISAFVYGGGVSLGTYLGGALSSWYGDRNSSFQTRLCAFGILAALPVYAGVLFLPGAHIAMLAMTPVYVGLYLCLSPTFALIQNLAPPEMRAMAVAIALLIINLIGMGLGPLMVGVLSDFLMPQLGPVEGLRMSMLCGLSVLAWSAFHYWRAGRTIAADLDAASVLERKTSLGDAANPAL